MHGNCHVAIPRNRRVAFRGRSAALGDCHVVVPRNRRALPDAVRRLRRLSRCDSAESLAALFVVARRFGVTVTLHSAESSEVLVVVARQFVERGVLRFRGIVGRSCCARSAVCGNCHVVIPRNRHAVLVVLGRQCVVAVTLRFRGIVVQSSLCSTGSMRWLSAESSCSPRCSIDNAWWLSRCDSAESSGAV
jgi:hypothetical protein